MSLSIKQNVFLCINIFLIYNSFCEIKTINDPQLLIDNFSNQNSRIPSNHIKSEQILDQSLSNDCSTFLTCFECSSKNECFWCKNNNKCEYYKTTTCSVDLKYYVNNTESSDYWFLNFYYMCNQLPTCGKTSFDLSSDEIHVSLSNNMKTYDACYWEISNSTKTNYSYSLERKGSGQDKIAMANFQISMHYFYQLDNSLGIAFNVTDESFYIKIIFYKNFGQNNNNKIIFKFVVNGNSKMSVFIICVIVISSIIGALVILLAIRCIYHNCCRVHRISNEIESENSDDDRNSSNIENIICNLKEVTLEDCKCTKQNDCTICLLPHDSNQRTVALPCHHFFHYECIKNWIKAKTRKPTCPNCNFDLFSKEQVQIPRGFLENENQIHEEKNPNTQSNSVNIADLNQNAPIFIGENNQNIQHFNKNEPQGNSFINDSNFDNNVSNQ